MEANRVVAVVRHRTAGAFIRIVRRLCACAMLVLLGGAVAAQPAVTDAPTPRAAVAPAQPAGGEARVILKYRESSALLRKRAFAATPQVDRVSALGARMGMTLRAGTLVADRVEVVHATGMDSDALAARLAAQPDVEYAVPDRLQWHYAAPNDPLYASGPAVSGLGGGPVVGQWYLRAPSAEVRSGIDVEGAWDVTLGAPDVVVAILDTGVLYDHPDLRPVAQGGNLLPGYDMITDTGFANDGNGRDADASDPGDWQTDAEAAQQCGFPCGGSNSSWHGTSTSSIVSALTNNGDGMASTARRVRILPVRVLGKGGGFDSDIIAGMRWAAGLAVPGVPTNSTPARVINMSLGSFETCSSAYRDAMTEITAAGTLVVASAGNSAGHAVSSPGNCPGVLAVAALRHAGTKVGFSDIGAEIGISAPGGNCVNIEPNTPCLYSIITATNSGTTTPVPSGFRYSDSFRTTIGTSFAAPIVAATAALVLTARPGMTPSQVRDVLRATARPFPTTGAEDSVQDLIPQCSVPAPIGFAQTDQLQCYCTTSTCGAGMLDAGAALRAVSGVRARISLQSAALRSGANATFDALASSVPAGRRIVSWRWRLFDGGSATLASPTDAATVMVNAVPATPFTLGLTVTDDAGVRAYAETQFTPTAGTLPVLDADGDGRVAALTDGVLVLRYLFGFTGTALTDGALDPAATRTDAAALLAYLASVRARLDADGSGDVAPLSDGLLVARFLFGFDGAALTSSALGSGATRTAAAEIRTYLQALSN